MSLAAGTKLGPYEILSPLGAGGMGEVYKARDPKLDRLVAIKVLPPSLTGAGDLLARFEREAKAVAALNHPNILGIYDFGTEGEHAYAVMELLEGESLRARLAQGALTPRVAIELAVQMAHGLAAAHDKGVIHRDLKPDNLWITTEGRLKILDFGLAKQVALTGRGSQSFLATEAVSPGHVLHTEEGMILGTLGYMSPEQVRGEAVDARSDIFSFGAVLFEMLAGRKAFARDTASDTMAAILRDDPPEGDESGKPIPAALRRIVDHCLEKIPARRFQSAKDLGFAIESAMGTTVSGSALVGMVASTSVRLSRRGLLGSLAGTAVLAAGGWGAFFWQRRIRDQKLPFLRLTFRRGMILDARFTPGGQGAIFSAISEDDGSSRSFHLSFNPTESAPLTYPPGQVLEIARDGEIGLLLRDEGGSTQTPGILMSDPGTLAVVAPGTTVPRSLDRNVQAASRHPIDGTWALVRSSGGQKADGREMERIEWPAGNTFYQGSVPLGQLRFSPDGTRLAFLAIAPEGYRVGILDQKGRQLAITQAHSLIRGMSWAPDGQSVWFGGFQKEGGPFMRLKGLSLKGVERVLLESTSDCIPLDSDVQGRTLVLSGKTHHRCLLFTRSGESRDLSWMDGASRAFPSANGAMVLLEDAGGGPGNPISVYARPTSGGPATMLAKGYGSSISPDGAWALIRKTPPKPSADGWAWDTLTLVPLGSGTERHIPMAPFIRIFGTALLNDNRHFIAIASKTGESLGPYLVDAFGEEPPRHFFAGGMSLRGFVAGTRSLVFAGEEGLIRVFLDGSMKPIPGTRPIEVPIGMSDENGWLFTYRQGAGSIVPIERVSLETGQREPWMILRPQDPRTVRHFRWIRLTSDGNQAVACFDEADMDLYLVEGLH